MTGFPPPTSHSPANTVGQEAIRPASARNVTAILGPTNTGKTHLAIERMVAHESGLIGLPLRLLAREVYTRVVEKAGEHNVALVTGEEKIVPDRPRFWVCTVEAMPQDLKTDFVAIDEVQLAGNLERGHIFTDRLLHMRGNLETLFLVASTMRPVLEELVPGISVVTRPRMSQLVYAGSKKISRLPRRSAIVAFSAQDVYAIAELIRRQSGGAAVVLGSLSPRTRNAQVDLFQNGDVDYLVATDAIGMGLNLDVDHVALASVTKYDGFQFRNLTAAEIAQIAGRAGRHTRNGTFGVTSKVPPFPDDLVEQLETHVFQPLKVIQWRTANLDFSSIRNLRNSLDIAPKSPLLTKAPVSVDIQTLEAADRNRAIRNLIRRPADVEVLWDTCRIPDYRKIAPAQHADLVFSIFSDIIEHGGVKTDWLASQIAYADRTDGDIDTIANRISHIRTWTYLANRSDWVENATYWQAEARAVEDKLSDALHEKLTQRFVDRRTSVLMKKLRESAMLDAEITTDGSVMVEGQHIGKLEGFRFSPDAESSSSQDAKTVRAAAQRALAQEMENRAEKISAAANDAFALSSDAAIRWQGALIAKLSKSEDTLKPKIIVIADENLNNAAKEKIEKRLSLWFEQYTVTHLQPLIALKNAPDVEGIARGLAFRLTENLGVLDRRDVASEVKDLDQTARGSLRKLGVRFGAYHIFVPQLLKPAPASLIAILWGLANDALDAKGIREVPELSAAGRTSVPADKEIPVDLYRVTGFKLSGERAVRIDILERLADLIRPLLGWKPTETEQTPPEGALNEFGFTVTVGMTSLLGCSGEDFNTVLKGLGYRVERRLIEKTEEEVQVETHETTASAEEVAAEAQTSEEVSVEQTATEAQPEETVTSEGETENASTEAALTETDEATADEPEYLEIWRPAPANRSGGHRSQNNRSNNQRGTNQNRDHVQHGKRHENQGGKGKKGKGKPPHKGKGPAGGKPRENKPLDPDSPFAKLAALKAGMGSDS